MGNYIVAEGEENIRVQSCCHRRNLTRISLIFADDRLQMVAANIMPSDGVTRIEMVEDSEALLVVVFVIVWLRLAKPSSLSPVGVVQGSFCG